MDSLQVSVQSTTFRGFFCPDFGDRTGLADADRRERWTSSDVPNCLPSTRDVTDLAIVHGR